MPMLDLDDIDRRIVAELQADARLTNIELADRVGLSASPCLRRVRRLTDEGVISGFRAILNRNYIGLGLTVFLAVKIDRHANDRALGFERAVTAMPEVVGCHLVAGEADYFLEVVVPDMERYRKFLVGKLLELPIVRDVRSSIAIQSLKADAALSLNHFDADTK